MCPFHVGPRQKDNRSILKIEAILKWLATTVHMRKFSTYVSDLLLFILHQIIPYIKHSHKNAIFSKTLNSERP